jgi:hypothetical protein
MLENSRRKRLVTAFSRIDSWRKSRAMILHSFPADLRGQISGV